MGPEQWVAAIAAEGKRVGGTSPDVLAAPIPSCPGWNARDLVGHIGRTHRWAASRSRGERTPTRELEADPALTDGELIAWYRDSVEDLLTTFERLGPDHPAWTFVGDATVAFWMRRQAHELLVHRWDLDAGVDSAIPRPVDRDLAVDGIDEWLSVFVPRFVELRGGIPDELVGTSIHLHTVEHDGSGSAGGEWLIRLTPDGVVHTREHAKGDAAVRGSASDLLLAVWHRLPLADLDVVGDPAVAESFLDLIRVT